jgi:mono/diheme cytochrome c family protein
MRASELASVIAAAGALAWLGGCAAPGTIAPPVTPAMAAASGTSAGTLNTGRDLFVTRCTSCHNADPVRSRGVAEWTRVVDEMAERSKLRPAERTALLAYLSAGQDAKSAVR